MNLLSINLQNKNSKTKVVILLGIKEFNNSRKIKYTDLQSYFLFKKASNK